MNHSAKTLQPRHKFALVLAGLLIGVPQGWGQATPPAPATPKAPGPEDETIVLSPFQVDASNDIGYYAENTLAGSRLRTNVGDLASSITVVTKQQLTDTSATNINDIFLYEANTQGAATYTPTQINRGYASDQIGGYSNDDGTPATIATANRVRGLGAVDTAQNNYPTIARLAFDTYNTNSVEINRGPNSMLFGTGSPAGIINQSTSEAVLGKTNAELEFKLGSFGARRASINLNVPVGDKLALFAAALYDDKAFERKPSYDRYRRQYISGTFQPTKKTKITASFENFRNNNSRPNFNTPSDYVSPWIGAGRPGWNPVTQQITFTDGGGVTQPYLIDTRDARYTTAPVGAKPPVGDAQLNTTTSPFFIGGIQVQTHNTMFVDNATPIGFWVPSATSGGVTPGLPAVASRTAADWLIASRRLTGSRGFIAPVPDPSTGANQYQVWNEVGVTNKALYNWDKYNISGDNYGTMNAKTYNIELQQEILPNLNFSAGWFRQELDEWDHYGLGQANSTPRLYVDTNTNNLDGSPNPYFGSPYVLDYQPDTFHRPETNNSVRGLLAYEVNFEKNDGWSRFLGHHRFLGLASQQKTWTNNVRYRLSFQGGDPRFIPTTAQLTATGNNRQSWAANAATIERHFYLGQDQMAIVQHGLEPMGEPGFGGPSNATLNFYDWNTRAFSSADMQMGTNLFYAGGNYGVATRKINAQNLAWQGYFWDERIIPTMGWRKDSVTILAFDNRDSSGNTLTNEAKYLNGFGIPGLETHLGAPYKVSGTTSTKGVVVRPFKGMAKGEGFFAELVNGLSFHYNESDNFNPPAGQLVDFFGNTLPLSSGKGKDYGIGTSMFNNKVSINLNWYKSSNNNAPASAAGTAIGRAQRIDTSAGKDWARQVVRIRTGGTDPANNPTNALWDNATVSPVTSAMEQQITDLLWGNFALKNYNWPAQEDYPGTINGTESNESKGLEFTMIYNPLRNWNIKWTVGQQDARYSNSIGELQAWLNFRKPQWEALAAPDLPNVYTKSNGNKLYLGTFWGAYGVDSDANSNTLGATSTPSSTYSGIVESQYFPLIANEGKKTASLREWSTSVITNYAFQEGRLKGFAIGGSYRWEDSATAGYYGLLDPTTYTHPSAGVSQIVFPDLNRPIVVPSESYVDLWCSYTTRTWSDKVKMKIQFNVRDVFESGGLQPIVFNFDGSPAQYRIKDPRQWFLTTTFDF